MRSAMPPTSEKIQSGLISSVIKTRRNDLILVESFLDREVYKKLFSDFSCSFLTIKDFVSSDKEFHVRERLIQEVKSSQKKSDKNKVYGIIDRDLDIDMGSCHESSKMLFLTDYSEIEMYALFNEEFYRDSFFNIVKIDMYESFLSSSGEIKENTINICFPLGLARTYFHKDMRKGLGDIQNKVRFSGKKSFFLPLYRKNSNGNYFECTISEINKLRPGEISAKDQLNIKNISNDVFCKKKFIGVIPYVKCFVSILKENKMLKNAESKYSGIKISNYEDIIQGKIEDFLIHNYKSLHNTELYNALSSKLRFAS